ncbi:unnamed protein product [Closterium sp. NIES-64]|nr:unnamed protein product [Closterium sp. NIES-64]
MSYWMLFSPLLAVQLAALMSALTQLAEGVMLLYAPESGRRFSAVVREHDPFMFVTRGMRLAGWWWRDDEVREEQKSLTASLFPGTYDTFEAVPPDHIKRMRKGQLAEEVVRLQAALAEQVETGKAQRQELERVQQEKVLCRVACKRVREQGGLWCEGGSWLERVQQEKVLCRMCFEREISLVLLPCRHRVLCHESSAALASAYFPFPLAAFPVAPPVPVRTIVGITPYDAKSFTLIPSSRPLLCPYALPLSPTPSPHHTTSPCSDKRRQRPICFPELTSVGSAPFAVTPLTLTPSSLPSPPHHATSPCADKCRQCPICRRHIADRMAVFDV